MVRCVDCWGILPQQWQKCLCYQQWTQTVRLEDIHHICIAIISRRFADVPARVTVTAAASDDVLTSCSNFADRCFGTIEAGTVDHEIDSLLTDFCEADSAYSPQCVHCYYIFCLLETQCQRSTSLHTCRWILRLKCPSAERIQNNGIEQGQGQRKEIA